MLSHCAHITLHFLVLAPPEVLLLKNNSTVPQDETKLLLECVAKGFYPKAITVRIKKGEQILKKKDGLQSTGVFKSEDGTFERKDHVEILKSDLSMYSCEVIHEAIAKNIIKSWGKKLLLLLFLSFVKVSFL